VVLETSNTRRLNPSGPLILGVILIFFSFSVSGAVSEGLIAHYPLNEESGNIAEDIEGNNDGDHINFDGGELGSRGVLSSAYELDNEYIDIGKGVSTGLNTASFSVWIKPDLLEAQNGILGEYSNGDGIIFSTLGGSQELKFYDGTNNHISNSDVVTKGKWQHVVATYEGGAKVKFFVNGKEVGVSSGAASSFNSGSDTVVGDLGHGFGSYFKGRIDDVRIYNKVLSKSDIQKLYQEPDIPPQVDTFKLNSSDVEIGDSVKVLANASDENITSVDLEVLEDGNELDLSESNKSGLFVSEGFRADKSYTKYNYSANFTDNSSQSTYVSNTFLTLGSPVRGGQKSFSTPENTVRGGESIFATGFGGAIQLNASEVEPGEAIKVSGTVYNDTSKVDGSVDLNSTGTINNLSSDFSSGKFSKTLKAGNNYGKYNLTSYVTSSGESFNISKEFEIKNSAPKITSAHPNGTNVNPDNVDISIEASDKSDLNISLFNITGATPSKLDKFKGKKQAETRLNNVQEDKKYTWRANITDGFSNVSRDFSFTTHSINITWDHEGGKRLEGFRIYSNASGNWREIKEVSAGKRQAIVFNKGLKTGEKASYRIRAYNNAGESPPAEAKVTPQLGGGS
jgi:hypothetical protein